MDKDLAVKILQKTLDNFENGLYTWARNPGDNNQCIYTGQIRACEDIGIKDTLTVCNDIITELSITIGLKNSYPGLLYDWNDAPERTYADVKKALEETITRLKGDRVTEFKTNEEAANWIREWISPVTGNVRILMEECAERLSPSPLKIGDKVKVKGGRVIHAVLGLDATIADSPVAWTKNENGVFNTYDTASLERVNS